MPLSEPRRGARSFGVRRLDAAFAVSAYNPLAMPRTWLAQLTRPERHTLVAMFAGWALDGMDVMAYTFLVPTLISVWRISAGQAGALATSALLFSAAGGWLAGLLADRYGRARILLRVQWTFALSAPPSLTARRGRGEEPLLPL